MSEPGSTITRPPRNPRPPRRESPPPTIAGRLDSNARARAQEAAQPLSESLEPAAVEEGEQTPEQNREAALRILESLHAAYEQQIGQGVDQLNNTRDIAAFIRQVYERIVNLFRNGENEQKELRQMMEGMESLRGQIEAASDSTSADEVRKKMGDHVREAVRKFGLRLEGVTDLPEIQEINAEHPDQLEEEILVDHDAVAGNLSGHDQAACDEFERITQEQIPIEASMRAEQAQADTLPARVVDLGKEFTEDEIRQFESRLFQVVARLWSRDANARRTAAAELRDIPIVTPSGRYRVIHEIGRGGFGIVLAIQKANTQETYVLKLSTPIDKKTELRRTGSLRARTQVLELVASHRLSKKRRWELDREIQRLEPELEQAQAELREAYVAKDPSISDRQQAVAVLQQELFHLKTQRRQAEDPPVAEYEEARLLEDPQNPDQRMAMLITEEVEGETLFETLDPRGEIPFDQGMGLAKEILAATKYMHNAGIYHRDLKPANVMVREDGKVKIIDLGMAAIPELVKKQESRLYRTERYRNTMSSLESTIQNESQKLQRIDKERDPDYYAAVETKIAEAQGELSKFRERFQESDAGELYIHQEQGKRPVVFALEEPGVAGTMLYVPDYELDRTVDVGFKDIITRSEATPESIATWTKLVAEQRDLYAVGRMLFELHGQMAKQRDTMTPEQLEQMDVLKYIALVMVDENERHGVAFQLARASRMREQVAQQERRGQRVDLSPEERRQIDLLQPPAERLPRDMTLSQALLYLNSTDRKELLQHARSERVQQEMEKARQLIIEKVRRADEYHRQLRRQQVDRQTTQINAQVQQLNNPGS